MEIRKIETEKQEVYASFITDIVEQCKAKQEVQAVCLLSYNYEGKDKIDLCIICDSKNYNRLITEDEKFLSEDYTTKAAEISLKYDTDFAIGYRSSRNYDSFLEKVQEFRECKDLVNSRLLFDRDGGYKKLKESYFRSSREDFIKGMKHPYVNLIEFIPPICKTI